MKWISVKDRLPEGNWGRKFPTCSEEVLVANSCSVSIGFYSKEGKGWFIGLPSESVRIDKITHWMSLPKNPHVVVRQRRHKGGIE